MASRTTPLAIAAAALLSLSSLPAKAQTQAHAQVAGGASPTSASSSTSSVSADAQAQAQVHFRRARELYQQGSYRDAIAALEQARTLDPNAKDLVYNLAVVSEKLGRIDDALKYMQSYSEMELSPVERTRAEGAIRRLEGAKRETPPTPPPVVQTVAPAAPPPPPPDPAHGRIDALTIGAAALAVGGFAVGTVFGLQAMSDRPQAGTVTQSPGSYAALEQQGRDAHAKAVVADVGFSVGVLATVGTAILYFTRTKPTKAAPPVPRIGLGVSSWPGRASIVLGGGF